MGGIWFVSYFAGYENPNLPGIKSFTALPERAKGVVKWLLRPFRAFLLGDLLPGVPLHSTPGYLISPLRGLRTTARHSPRKRGIQKYKQ
jgi:hypothetical protein